MAVRTREDAGVPPLPVVGGYRLERIVSEEPAFHVLYDGIDVDTGEEVFVKVFAVETDRALVRRFIRAARARASIEHPHLLDIHRASEWQGRLVLASEPGDLPTLADRLRTDPPGRNETIEILRQVANALDAAAAAGVIDHELSPASIMLHPERGALLGDLGIAVSLVEGLPPWAQPYPQYISPEAARGEPLERRSNVYSLAAVLLECMTGKPPFEGSLQLVAYSHAAEAPPFPSDRDPDLGEGFDAVMQVALAKRPQDRFESSREFIDAAADVLAVAQPTIMNLLEPAPLARPAAPEAPRREKRELSRRTRIALVALPLAAVVAVGGYLAGDSGGESSAPVASAPPGAPSPRLVTAAYDTRGAMARLDRRVRSGRTRLASARTPRGQARAAAGLARSYGAAAAAIAAIEPARGLDPDVLVPPLRAASRGYSRLGRAARSGNRRAYAAARGDVATAESALRRGLAGLQPGE